MTTTQPADTSPRSVHAFTRDGIKIPLGVFRMSDTEVDEAKQSIRLAYNTEAPTAIVCGDAIFNSRDFSGFQFS